MTGYRVERCSGAGLHDVRADRDADRHELQRHGLTDATAYSYRVRAVDAAGNRGRFRTRARRDALADATPPSAPGALTASAVSRRQINLAGDAATDNVGVTGYRVERCQGAGCTTFAQIATPTGTTFNDTGLTASTSYNYRVRARRCGGQSGRVLQHGSATTQAPPDTHAPSAPATLTASVVSATQINLGWSAATDNVGVTGYRVERCQGAGCSDFRADRDADRRRASATRG